MFACMHAQSLQSRLTLCDPVDCSPPGSSVHGDSPAKNTGVGCHTFSRRSSQPRDRTCVSCRQADSLPLVPPGKPSKCIQCLNNFYMCNTSREVIQLGSLGQGALEPGCLISNPISAISLASLSCFISLCLFVHL